MNYIEFLRALINHFQVHDWIQNEMSTTQAGIPVASTDKNAKCFCLLGGAVNITGGFGYADNLEKLRLDLNAITISSWNDLKCHSKTMLISTLQSILKKYEEKELPKK